jgi:xylulose-5-phosphate/fructose-6-phosphate phosphoketolase
MENPLLREPLAPGHIKPRLLGHWGTTPGLNFIYAHLNRLIISRGLDLMQVVGPGHGGPALFANAWLAGCLTGAFPGIPRDEAGMRTLFREFSFPGGMPSHAAPQAPGSINEGGELDYSLLHGYGAAFDNPNLIVACVIGDGEAETGALAASWHSNKLLEPVSDGAVLPILHLNGYKIANPSVLARIPAGELDSLPRGYGYVPRYVEGTARAHQIPLADVRGTAKHRKLLEEWLRSYRPEELFDPAGRPVADLDALVPDGERRIGANPHANGGLLLRDLALPSFRSVGPEVRSPTSSTRCTTSTPNGWRSPTVSSGAGPSPR